MSALNPECLDALAGAGDLEQLLQIHRGLEKESLRITPDGQLAQTPHPRRLGSALTNSRITTDFSEALLEFITPPTDSVDEVLKDLDDVHRFTYGTLQNELLWVASMPCILDDDKHIPVANYGHSNVARMKTVYRLGLGRRYGRLMQTIAGIHFNFSVSDAFWAWWREQQESTLPQRELQTEGYFGLIRNFHRLAWLLVYLFGASPALCKSFIGQRSHHLSELTRGTLHAPWGTSLRMGDLGYQSTAQDGLDISYNCLDEYVSTLGRAVREPHPDYVRIGVRDDSEYLQLSSSLLQIENEYYGSIRPKRIAHSGEAPRRALADRGVEYVEVRCLDLDPNLPLGIDDGTVVFIETFLMYCLLLDSPWSDAAGRRASRDNLQRVVNRGREPGLALMAGNGDRRSVQTWGIELLEAMRPIATLLDRVRGEDRCSRSLDKQVGKMDDPGKTPSARLLTSLRERDEPFFNFAMRMAQQHRRSFLARPLPGDRQTFFEALSSESLEQQAAIEAADTESFEDYLARFYSQ